MQEKFIYIHQQAARLTSMEMSKWWAVQLCGLPCLQNLAPFFFDERKRIMDFEDFQMLHLYIIQLTVFLSCYIYEVMLAFLYTYNYVKNLLVIIDIQTRIWWIIQSYRKSSHTGGNSRLLEDWRYASIWHRWVGIFTVEFI